MRVTAFNVVCVCVCVCVCVIQHVCALPYREEAAIDDISMTVEADPEL